MKLLVILSIAILLSACASMNSAPGAGEGTVVVSTSYDELCKPSLNNGLLPFVNAENGKWKRAVSIRNVFTSIDFEENGTIVHALALPAGEYQFNEFMKPNILFPAFLKDHYPYSARPYEFTVVAGEINYVGNVLIHEVDGSCDKSHYGMTVTDKSDRDMPVAEEKFPQFFTPESL